MNPITWFQFGLLVVQEGFPFAVKMWQMMQSGGSPTPEQIAELEALSRNTASIKLADAISRNGIDLSSPQAIALLALVKTP